VYQGNIVRSDHGRPANNWKNAMQLDMDFCSQHLKTVTQLLRENPAERSLRDTGEMISYVKKANSRTCSLLKTALAEAYPDISWGILSAQVRSSATARVPERPGSMIQLTAHILSTQIAHLLKKETEPDNGG